MSLMKSLARVAAGVMLAKGIGTMMKNAQNRPQSAGGRGSGGLLDELFGNNTGGAGNRSAGSGGLGGLLDQLTGSRGGPGSGGVLGGAAAGGLGGMLGDLLGGRGAQAQQAPGQPQPGAGGLAQKDAQPQNDASFGELFNEALASGDEPSTAPTPEQNALAGLMLKAMIQAAKSDGEIDENEKAKLMDQFGELDDEERAFIREQMAAPVDAAALAREVPEGFGPQVYLMSLMAIELDNRKEAEYLHTLAQGLGLDKETVNGIHQKVGVINLYA
ncbi:MAG: tellurite resistance TerB family protein [Paracoccus sp. BP8]|nr:MAG: tellurite resistance TerB family protein [Paracoccus sp. BP8]